MAKNKSAKMKDDWQDVPLDDWQDVPINISSQPSSLMPKAPSPGDLSREAKSVGRAIVGGAAEPLTLGYYKRLLPDGSQREFEKSKAENPLAYGLSNVAASLSPAGPLNLFRGAKGAVSGLKAGAMLGAAYDPGGEDVVDLSGRLERGIGGAVLGGGLDLLGAGRNYLAGGFRTRQAARSPGFSRGVKEEIDQTISDAYAKDVAPRAKELKSILENKRLELGSANVDAIGETFPNYAKKLRERMVTEYPGEGPPRITVPAERALRLRQKFDELADYRKQKALSGEAVSGKSSEQVRKAADVLRGKISDVDPRVGPLQQSQSKSLRIIKDVEGRSLDPVALAKTRPGIQGGDTGSLIRDVENLAGSNRISKAGQRIRLAEKMEPQMTMRPLQIPQEIFKAQTLGAGAVAAGLEGLGKMPVLRNLNPRDAFLLQTLQPRTLSQEEIEELTRQAMEEQ